jgi:hypothetical protein
MSLDATVKIVEGDLVGESSAGLVAGETLTVRTLLYGLLLKSGNDAAMAIARAAGGSPHGEDATARGRFIAMMNAKATELGLGSTSFRNPHGLDETGHYSTAHDLARMTMAALAVPGFTEIFGARSYQGEGYTFTHGNRLPELMAGVIGGKTGWTDGCGLCLIEVAEQRGRPIIVVLLNSDWGWFDDAYQLYQFASSLQQPAVNSAAAVAVFDRLWSRTDLPVHDGQVTRSWLWGPALGHAVTLTSASAPSGWCYERLYEKGLMEINDPYARMDTGWYVTPGLLASRLLDAGSTLPVAGDLTADSVDYATLAAAAGSTAIIDGAMVTTRLTSDGGLWQDDRYAEFGVFAGSLVPETNLHIADVFEAFMAQTGLVLDGGALVEALLFDPPLLAIGLPVTDPLWLKVELRGIERDVLVQCFERRCLTYTPSNPAGWEVEMTNIGQHYALWFGDGQYATAAEPSERRHRAFTSEARQTAHTASIR